MPEELVSLIKADTVIKVSSTLDRSVGKKHLVDGNPETCWTSQQGLPQYIHLTFGERVIPKRISITFQGGFVGTQCAIQTNSDTGNGWKLLYNIYPEDVNRQQFFELVADADTVQTSVSAVKLVFEQSSDFFGRITVYDLQLEGAFDN